LRQRLGRRAGFGDDDQAGAGERQARRHFDEGRGIDIVHEPELGPPALGPESLILQRDQSLAAETRTAGAEHDHMLELREALGMRLEQREIVAGAGQTEQRQRAVGLPLPEPVERLAGVREFAVERGTMQSLLADLAFERVVDHVAVEHRETTLLRVPV
jgi:hypothetical protein